MLLVARKVLSDCRRAHEMLEFEPKDDNFRIVWVAGIALARAVGHVLDEVESKTDQNLSHIIRAKYLSWKQDKETSAIFWDFIDDERNRVLKEYEQGFLAGPIVVTAAGQQFSLEENLFTPLGDGRYAGEDCRDVLERAILWWESQLNDIEAEYKILVALSKPPSHQCD